MSGPARKSVVMSNVAEAGSERMLSEGEVAELLEAPPRGRNPPHESPGVMNSTFFGLLAEFGEANIPPERVAPKYFGQSYGEARRNALAKLLPCRVFRLGGQKSPWLVSAFDLAELIDRQRKKAG